MVDIPFGPQIESLGRMQGFLLSKEYFTNIRHPLHLPKTHSAL